MIDAAIEHPVTTGIRGLLDTMATFSDTPLYGLSPADRDVNQRLLARARAALDELDLRHAHQASLDDADAKTAWVRGTRQSPRTAAARIQLACALAEREPLRVAMTRGEVSEAQAHVVVAALEALPADLEPELLERAELHLLDLCTDHHPDELRRLGRKLLEVVAPDLAEAHEATTVEAEYQRATERCRLDLVDRHDGTWTIHGVLPALHGHLLHKLVMAFGAPKHRAHARKDSVLAPRRRGQAFCELLERYPTGKMPHTGGLSARVMVQVSLDDLRQRTAVATVDGVVPIPAGVARRMACEAGILPAVLGGKSEVLDLGRTRRFHTEAQRTAAFTRDRTCRAEGCDWPAWAGHLHHQTPWSQGGSTTVTDAVSLCPHPPDRAASASERVEITTHEPTTPPTRWSAPSTEESSSGAPELTQTSTAISSPSRAPRSSSSSSPDQNRPGS